MALPETTRLAQGELWGMMDYPGGMGTMVSLETTLPHNLFNITVAECIGQIPASRLQNHILVKMSPRESIIYYSILTFVTTQLTMK